MASIHIDIDTARDRPIYVRPEEEYNGPNPEGSDIELRIATDGAGKSRLVRELANTFLTDYVKGCKNEKFGIAWLKSDTSGSFNYLAQNSADVAITYHEAAEDIAIAQGIADRRVYAGRDHFMLVAYDPGDLKEYLKNNKDVTVYDLFSHLFRAAIKTASSKKPVNFISRYDKSATNIKQSAIWARCGQTPWSYPYSYWYHRLTVFPFQSLEMAAKLEEYTLTDRGTWLGVEAEVKDQLEILMEGKDDDEDPVLLNPARLLVGSYGQNKDIANAFADWIEKPDGGQKVIKGFAKNGKILYTVAPPKK